MVSANYKNNNNKNNNTNNHNNSNMNAMARQRHRHTIQKKYNMCPNIYKVKLLIYITAPLIAGT
jgi:hypothetical protein